MVHVPRDHTYRPSAPATDRLQVPSPSLLPHLHRFTSHRFLISFLTRLLLVSHHHEVRNLARCVERLGRCSSWRHAQDEAQEDTSL